MSIIEVLSLPFLPVIEFILELALTAIEAAGISLRSNCFRAATGQQNEQLQDNLEAVDILVDNSLYPSRPFCEP